MLPPLKNGEVLRGRYKIHERIGQGGMGSIYLADDIRLKGRQCALKEVEYDRALPENIRQEAREQLHAGLHDPQFLEQVFRNLDARNDVVNVTKARAQLAKDLAEVDGAA